MAYAAVTSLMETLSLHFLQSQPGSPLEHLDEQLRYGNEKIVRLQQILEDMAAMELHEAYSNLSCIKACLFREAAEIKHKMVSFHETLGFLRETLEKSQICYDNNAGAMKDLEAEMRDVLFGAEEWIEMELTSIYLEKDRLYITVWLLRLHEIFIEVEKMTDYLKNQLLIRLAKASSQNKRITDDVSLLGWMRSRGLLLVKGLAHKNITVSKSSKKASKLDSGMVGCHEVFMKILDQLTQQSTRRRQVVSIVGMGGIGKTTLARKVYEDSSITSYFDMQAWTTVSQEYSLEQMLRCLIGGVIAESRDELHEQNTDQLAERLRKHLKDQRYLIVIDDIWSTAAWDSVQRCFPDDNNGSRILLTSRLREVAEYVSSGKSPLNMPFLNADESWNLYCKVFGKTEFLLVFEQIGKDIVKKCKGLPLAITIVASLLSKTEEVEEKWKNVAKSVMSDSNDAYSRILYLSYNQLPHPLKACFLYFGIFEEDYEIPVKKLVRLWVAEGFLSIVKHVNTEKVAMECLQDLVDRSLVIVSK
ncbi:putative late blight resistance protein homolog R1B-16 [Ipomoea triloba]|uniref:putative late blight resistance protein homolog R1B-16 n=1 Tax=Ipomoea triloba TaxID=35885 RepID=UPI00125DCA91|nr:putative late blight resistance protein homolog R1B-16 [Ipomoea triloba]